MTNRSFATTRPVRKGRLLGPSLRGLHQGYGQSQRNGNLVDTVIAGQVVGKESANSGKTHKQTQGNSARLSPVVFEPRHPINSHKGISAGYLSLR